jgi:hypothetical protein
MTDPFATFRPGGRLTAAGLAYGNSMTPRMFLPACMSA